MKKNVIKEIIIVLLLALAIILILGVLLYGFIPTNKIIPETISYTTPASIQEELQTDENIDDSEVVVTYRIDSTDLSNYKNVTSMTPNLPDTQKFIGYELDSFEKITNAGNEIISKTNAKAILITCGSDGMVVVNSDGTSEKIPVFNRSKVFDVTGAGDTVTALYTLGLAIGAEPVYAAVIGNIAASIVIKQFGCATTTIEEILETLENINLKGE